MSKPLHFHATLQYKAFIFYGQKIDIDHWDCKRVQLSERALVQSKVFNGAYYHLEHSLTLIASLPYRSLIYAQSCSNQPRIAQSIVKGNSSKFYNILKTEEPIFSQILLCFGRRYSIAKKKKPLDGGTVKVSLQKPLQIKRIRQHLSYMDEMKGKFRQILVQNRAKCGFF